MVLSISFSCSRYIQESHQLENESEGGGPAAFKPGVQEVEFKVRVGFTHLTSKNDGHMSRNKRKEKEWQTQNCKIVCKQGQWIGPLCRESKGKYCYINDKYCSTRIVGGLLTLDHNHF